MQFSCIGVFLLLQLLLPRTAASPDATRDEGKATRNRAEGSSAFLGKRIEAEGDNDDDDANTETAPSASRQLWGWKRSSSPPDEALLHELVFRVKQNNLDQLQQMAMDRTDPNSTNYGKWLSRAEIQNMTRNTEGLQAVKQALLSGGSGVTIMQETAGGEFVRAVAPVAAWAKLLRTEFHVYERDDPKEVAIRADSYKLPKLLRKHVAGILKAVDLHDGGFFSAKVGDTEISMDASAPVMEQELRPGLTTPARLRKAYNVPPVALEGSPEAKERMNTSQAVYASLGQHWSPSDRQQFQVGLGLPLNSVTELDSGNSVASDSMCQSKGQDCMEANLDVQYMMSMSPYSQMGLYYTPENSTFSDFLVSFADLEEAPEVISISYGEDEVVVSDSMVEAFETEAMKLALQGITVIVSSGDDGAAGQLARHRWMGYFPSCGQVEEYGLQVSWPASSAWVTSVGATMGLETDREPEVVCQVNASKPWGVAPPTITSGGGFSNFVKTPEWQMNVNSGEGRGVPDVAVNGHAYAIVVGGKWTAVDGTSASAPAFAGMISILNSRRKAKGLTTLGFLNQLLYANPDAFNDITIGDNRCATSGNSCCGGYDATEGWDPVTGLGTPDFSKLEQASEQAVSK